MIIWGWVGVSTTPNAFMALGQGTEFLKGMKIPRETEIVLGNVVRGKRSELQKAGSNNK